ncbi:MAG TPA: hypothetical protein VFJ66_01350 [Gaiellales bacterium]|nr:hypothetical protein [Gaiellales bacterium]
MIRIGLLVACCMLALVVAAGGRARAQHSRASDTPQPINLTIRFKMAEDLG